MILHTVPTVRGGKRDPYIIQALVREHKRKLSVAYAYRLEDVPSCVGYVNPQKHFQVSDDDLDPATFRGIFHGIIQKVVYGRCCRAAVVEKSYPFRAVYGQFNSFLFQWDKDTVNGSSQGIGDKDLFFSSLITLVSSREGFTMAWIRKSSLSSWLMEAWNNFRRCSSGMSRVRRVSLVIFRFAMGVFV